ncbi:MAG: RimK family alpha-L-glutamate ligase, partial [Gammaproteobacteria bacterium]
TLAVNDRHGLQQRLETAGLPVPTGSLATTWAEALALAQGRAVVVKAVDGRLGRGARVVVVEAAAGPPEAPFPGPYLVQDRVTHDGWDRKVYVAGPAYRGLLKPWPRRGSADRRPFAPEPMLGDLALAVGRVLGLEIYGVDFVVGGTGPLIVDVNVFPGFKGVPEAARLIVDHLIERDAASVRI